MINNIMIIRFYRKYITDFSNITDSEILQNTASDTDTDLFSFISDLSRPQRQINCIRHEPSVHRRFNSAEFSMISCLFYLQIDFDSFIAIFRIIFRNFTVINICDPDPVVIINNFIHCNRFIVLLADSCFRRCRFFACFF